MWTFVWEVPIKVVQPDCLSVLEQVVNRAVASQPDVVDVAERAEKFRQKYRHKLQTLRHQPL